MSDSQMNELGVTPEVARKLLNLRESLDVEKYITEAFALSNQGRFEDAFGVLVNTLRSLGPREDAYQRGVEDAPCVLGEPLRHGPEPYRWCATHNRLLLTCEQSTSASTEYAAGWTKDIPRNGDWYVAGNYFQRRLSNHARQIVEVNQHGVVWRIGAANTVYVNELRETGDYEWLGPITAESFAPAVVEPAATDDVEELARRLIKCADRNGELLVGLTTIAEATRTAIVKLVRAKGDVFMRQSEGFKQDGDVETAGGRLEQCSTANYLADLIESTSLAELMKGDK